MVGSITNVFETMLSIDLTQVAGPYEPVDGQGEMVIGSVGFAGTTKGAVYIHFQDEFATVVAGTMLGMEPDEFGVEEVDDVIGELSNMVGGNIKSSLCDSGMTCSLSVPSVTRGPEVVINPREVIDGVVKECVFKSGQHSVRLVVALMPGD